MLEIINKLKPFFEDNYRRINVRKYARMQKISPPNASTFLKKINKEGLLNKEEENRYIYFYANRNNKTFTTLQRVYYLNLFEKIGLLDYLEKELVTPTIILFGSYAKGEINQNSDIDLAIFSPSKKINLEKFEKKLGKTIQVFSFRKKEDIKNKNLLNNILNGFILKWGW
ncbi:MAG: nucleotidyltransferase domain-containing protein [Nanoarchaeota archaeon]|nr:nucleotidyltransferase domain-containing protein [Nanoarchaeota archaeon]